MKNLIREIHRRSLWQVLGVYLAVSWIVLQVVDVVGNNFGLPDWVAPAALVLLLLGFPIVIATAFVQEGLTTKEPEAPQPSLADAGEVVPPPTPDRGGRHGLFTWRNALVGGVAAFALLGILTAGYLFMRTSGIGPAGTLVAQGVLEEGAQVILADFESTDSELAEVVTGALRIDLLQSPTIQIVERTELSAALARMQRDQDAAITTGVARELAAREGYGAVIQGEIGTAGAGYVLTASIVGGEGWTSLAAFRATARSEDDLIDAIENLSRDIRDKSGESLRTIRSAPPLERVTTTSIEALRAYSRGEALEDDADREGAAELYERAIELDPEFAMAHRKLAVVLGNMGIRRSDEVAALKRSFELRERLPDAERYLAEAYYYTGVRGDRASTSRAYERLLDIDPDNTSALNNLALAYQDMGRFEEAESLLERALDLEMFQVGVSNLALARYQLGQDEAAGAVLDMGAEALPGAQSLFEGDRIDIAISRQDYEGADALTSAFAERFPGPRDVVRLSTRRYVLDAVHGRLDAAEGWIEQFDEAPSFSGHPIVMAANRSSLYAARGDSANAVSLLLDAFGEVRESLPAEERFYGFGLLSLLRFGAEAEASALLDEWVREIPEDELGQFGWDARREVDARLAFARGDLDGAVRLWEVYERACPGTCAMTAALGLARVHETAGETGAAIAEYERFLADRGTNRSFEDATQRAPVLESLGELYDGQGDPAAAASYYAMFVDLWADADEELQPRVQAARARLAELGGSTE
jgi:tetratricopeptide (TPR) repeat protein